MLTCRHELVLNPSRQETARVEGLDNVADILARCSLRECVYRTRYEADSSSKSRADRPSLEEYRNSLRALYLEVLTFQATCAVYLVRNLLIKGVEDMVKWNKWDDMLKVVDEKESKLGFIEEKLKELRIEEEWEEKRRQHESQIKNLGALKDEVSRFRNLVKESNEKSERQKLFQWLTVVDPSEYHNRHRNHHDTYSFSTGDWLVKDDDMFRHWMTEKNSLIWLHGKGKPHVLLASSSWLT